ncbi:MAG: hypothetical protein AAF485_13355 [Chloroflexota bacterium]
MKSDTHFIQHSIFIIASWFKRLSFLMAILLVTILAPTSHAQDFPDVCLQPENLMPNCTFDNGTNGWQPFIESGSASFSVLQGGGECHAPLCPAGYIVTEDHFIGGIYQQVPVTAGNTYYTNIVWLAFDSLANDEGINSLTGGIGRWIGIDPTGGTDSRSPNIIWSPDNWRNDCKICNVEQAIAQAQADTITVFLKIDDSWRLRAAEKGYAVPTSKDQFWIDDIGLKQVDNALAPAPQAEAPPTETPIPADTVAERPAEDTPPTDTPVPTHTPVPEEEAVEDNSEEPVEEEEPSTSEEDSTDTEATEETESATPTATTHSTLAPPPTITPTSTPTPQADTLPLVVADEATPVVDNRPAPTPVQITQATPPVSAGQLAEQFLPESLSPEVLGVAGTTICVSGVLLMILAVFMMGLTWLYRAGWEDEDDDDDDFDEDGFYTGEDIEVEIVA